MRRDCRRFRLAFRGAGARSPAPRHKWPRRRWNAPGPVTSMRRKRYSRCPHRGGIEAGFGALPRGGGAVPATTIKINSDQRSGLYELVRNRLPRGWWARPRTASTSGSSPTTTTRMWTNARGRVPDAARSQRGIKPSASQEDQHEREETANETRRQTLPEIGVERHEEAAAFGAGRAGQTRPRLHAPPQERRAAYPERRRQRDRTLLRRGGQTASGARRNRRRCGWSTPSRTATSWWRRRRNERLGWGCKPSLA